jgi:hypothetical protein
MKRLKEKKIDLVSHFHLCVYNGTIYSTEELKKQSSLNRSFVVQKLTLTNSVSFNFKSKMKCLFNGIFEISRFLN